MPMNPAHTLLCLTAGGDSSPAPGEHFVISAWVAWHDTGTELALLHTGSQRYFGLNPTASEIWRLLANRLAMSAIIAQLAQRYDANPAAIAVEVRRVIAALVQAGLLDRAPVPETTRS